MPVGNVSKNRRALPAGIDRYAQDYFTRPHGCVNHVELMAGILRQCFGFPPGNITLLTDGGAPPMAGPSRLQVATGAPAVRVPSAMRQPVGHRPDAKTIMTASGDTTGQLRLTTWQDLASMTGSLSHRDLHPFASEDRPWPGQDEWPRLGTLS